METKDYKKIGDNINNKLNIILGMLKGKDSFNKEDLENVNKQLWSLNQIVTDQLKEPKKMHLLEGHVFSIDQPTLINETTSVINFKIQTKKNIGDMENLINNLKPGSKITPLYTLCSYFYKNGEDIKEITDLEIDNYVNLAGKWSKKEFNNRDIFTFNVHEFKNINKNVVIEEELEEDLEMQQEDELELTL
jgi:hypothetical protein